MDDVEEKVIELRLNDETEWDSFVEALNELAVEIRRCADSMRGVIRKMETT